MADIYNSYLRLRLLDVVVKRNSSSKAASKISMDCITHVGGTMFSVLSENDQHVSYSVDLAIGLCTCPSGNTGAICKHQIGCSQFSAVLLPQSFSFSAKDRRALARVALGDKELPDIEFFQGLKEPLDSTESCSRNVLDLTDKAASEEEPNTLQLEEETKTSNSSTFDSALEHIRTLILKFNTSEVDSAVQVFSSRSRNIKNAAQLESFLRTAGSSLFLRNGSLRRKILCQPTAVSRRRSGQSRGRGRLLHGGGIKRRRNLATNIKKNQPNAKIH